MDVDGGDWQEAQLSPEVDADIWRQEAALIPDFYQKFGEHLPKGLWAEYEALAQRIVGAFLMMPVNWFCFAAKLSLQFVVLFRLVLK